MGRVLLLSKSVLFILAGEVVVAVVLIKGGSWRLPILPLPVPLPASFRGVNTIEDVGNVDSLPERRLRLAPSVQVTFLLLRCIAR